MKHSLPCTAQPSRPGLDRTSPQREFRMSFSKSILALATVATLTFAAVGTAQATVVKSVAGSATTYTETFNNNATSFSLGEYNAASTSDDYLWLTNSQKATWSFTSATALQSVTI